MRILTAAVCGALFGIGLYLSGMTDTRKVQGFLDVTGTWDPTLMFVMGGALLPMAIAWRLTQGRTPRYGGSFPAPLQHRPDRNLATGAILFGMGWGLAGLCPGPAMASLSYGGSGGVIFLVAMIAGMLIAVPARRRLDTAGGLT
ncbi:DUF6691 family protein [uncultured Roseobacter sp.]|uniref:DUF6691 family protein n=1 Tax=uncultured Roseobacter sp. TaxID=114847 RepID=UPI0026199196|nr:DUF6691 family protein [uncultured Roseobacter sp.]